ncbi:MAG: TcpQ domain-containing protein [Micavibrio sp.]|nr:TcpQ domain-containing protein [Micavibrio sp.]
MKTSPFQISLLKKALLFSGVAMIAFASHAQAGFEWKGPLEAPHAASAPAADSSAPMNDDMAPVTADAPAAMPAPRAPAVAPAPVAQQPIPAAMPAAMPAPQAAPEATGETLTGFGSDLPLVIALQQVVPAGYQYSFASGVNPGTHVSWEGGKPWQQVLSDMLGKQNLGYQLQNNTVVVSEDATDGAAAAPAQTGAAAPVWHAPNGSTNSTPPAMPADDLGPVSITSAAPAAAPAPAATPAPEAAPAAAPAAATAAPVTIHREKKKSFFERLGWTKSSDDADDEADTAAKHEVKTQVDEHKDRSSSAAPAATPAAAPAADLTAPPASTKTENVAADAAPEKNDSMSAPQSLTAAAPAAAEPATAAPAVANGDWTGKKGQTLREVLKAWSDKAGVELYWSIDYDYRLSADAGYDGKYEDAVGGLLDRFSSVRPQPYGQLHQSAGGPRVLVVKSYDLTR